MAKSKKELHKKENIKIKCPSCKDWVPSNASRCSHCNYYTADLSGDKYQAYIQRQFFRPKRLGIVIIIVVSVSLIVWVVNSIVTTPQQPRSEGMNVRIGDAALGNKSDPYSAHVIIENNNSFNWEDCDLELNGAFKAHMEVISVNSQENKILIASFVKKGGEFFDIRKYTFNKFEVKCKKPYFDVNAYEVK